MFGFGKKKDDAVVEAVCSKLRPLFGILEHRLGGFPAELARDPYVLGYVVGASTIFTQIETTGRASTELRGRAALAALQTAFASLNMTVQQASTAMQSIAGNAVGKTDRDNEPEVVFAKKAVEAMPSSLKQSLGGSDKSLLMHELQEQVFFAVVEARYRAK